MALRGNNGESRERGELGRVRPREPMKASYLGKGENKAGPHLSGVVRWGGVGGGVAGVELVGLGVGVGGERRVTSKRHQPGGIACLRKNLKRAKGTLGAGWGGGRVHIRPPTKGGCVCPN